MEHTPLLDVQNLTKRFGGLVAVNALSFTVCESGIHSLIGPNGSGKSTTINLISNVLRADEGSILFEGKEIIGKPTHEVAQLGLRRTYQHLNLFDTMTISENLMIGLQSQTSVGIVRSIFHNKIHRSEEAYLRERADETAEFLNLYSRRNEMVNAQPYGIQKLVSIGVALVAKPKLLLLDEPAAGLNPSERVILTDIIGKIFQSGTRVLLVEHNMDVVMNISKKITVLSFSKKIAEGTPDEIKSNDEVIKAYLGRKFHKKPKE